SLNVKSYYIGKSTFDYLVEVESEEIVRALAPDFTRLSRVKTRGVIVTSRATTPGFDFVSRFFAPAVGINEDPVTGSAHCCLGPYWQDKLKKNEMTAYQASSRGGVIRLKMGRKDRITVSGQAVTVVRGELL
ncbi:MAG: PhzF family phenazine biosynthesis protein, partial [Pseudomonadota bacterium]